MLHPSEPAGSVLVVEHDAQLRDTFGKALESAGFDVMTCPGPGVEPCVGLHAGHCPLTDDADVVVMDGSLQGDVLMEGPGSEELISYYRSIGLPVVVVESVRRLIPARYPGPEIQILHSPPRPEELLRAVRRAVPARTHGGVN